MAKLKGLGRGLDALLASHDEQPPAGALQTLNIDQLQPGKYQPRTQMDQESLEMLAQSIKSQGIMQPILVRRLSPEGHEIIAGERRWRAARIAGLTEVPVLVKEIPDEAALAMSLIENIQRENLNPLEEAAGLQRLITEFSLTHQLAAEAVGRSRGAVTNLLRLLSLAPPVQTLMMENGLDMGHARALLPLDVHKQTEVARHIASNGLSVRETEKMVRQLLNPPQKKEQKSDQDVLRLQEELSGKLGTRVTIKSNRQGKGKMVIEFTSLEQFDDLLRKLG